MKDVVYVIWDIYYPPKDIRALQQFKTLTNCQKRVNNYNKNGGMFKVQAIQLKLI